MTLTLDDVGLAMISGLALIGLALVMAEAWYQLYGKGVKDQE